MSGSDKTNAMRILDRAKKSYRERFYESADGAIDGVSVAKKVGIEPERVFKTLVTEGHSRSFFVFVIPVAAELDLKRAAVSVGEKSVEMIKVVDINRVTGYVRGGCSPIGMKKNFVTRIDSSAQNFDAIVFSGGRIGTQIEMKPKDLAEVARAEFAELTRE